MYWTWSVVLDLRKSKIELALELVSDIPPTNYGPTEWECPALRYYMKPDMSSSSTETFIEGETH